MLIFLVHLCLQAWRFFGENDWDRHSGDSGHMPPQLAGTLHGGLLRLQQFTSALASEAATWLYVAITYCDTQQLTLLLRVLFQKFLPLSLVCFQSCHPTATTQRRVNFLPSWLLFLPNTDNCHFRKTGTSFAKSKHRQSD